MNHKQFTKEEAIAFYKSNKWQEMSAQEIVDLQLYQQKLCVPFDEFHKAIEEVFGRSVWTHEFAFLSNLRKEYEGKRDKPSFEEIITLIPEEKSVIVLA